MRTLWTIAIVFLMVVFMVNAYRFLGFVIRDTDWRSVTRNSLVAVRDVMVLWAVIIATGFVTMHLIGYTP
jgi:hypothetical protein